MGIFKNEQLFFSDENSGTSYQALDVDLCGIHSRVFTIGAEEQAFPETNFPLQCDFISIVSAFLH